MTSYKIKVKRSDWISQTIALLLLVLISLWAIYYRLNQDISFGQLLPNIAVIAIAAFNFLLFSINRFGVVKLGKDSLEYRNAWGVHNIVFIDTLRIERTNWNPTNLTCFTTSKKFVIPLKIEGRDDFLNNLVEIIEHRNYKIEFDKENILFGKLKTKIKKGQLNETVV